MIALTWETKALLAKLEAIRVKGVKYALSMAMTWTAKDASAAFAKEILQKVDRPTPMTQRASRFKAATTDRTEYDVFVQDEASKGNPPSKYLKAMVQGGYRANKRAENLLRAKNILPGGWQIEPGQDAPLDQYGNLKGGGAKYVQILSALQAFRETGHTMNRTAASTKRNAKTQRDYFVLYSIKTKTPLGVYTRKGKRGIAQILKFTPKRAKYAQSLHFRETIQRTFTAFFEGYFRKGLQIMLEKVKSW
jgi:hypothetical protein